jgi:hypothetical protein
MDIVAGIREMENKIGLDVLDVENYSRLFLVEKIGKGRSDVFIAAREWLEIVRAHIAKDTAIHCGLCSVILLYRISFAK